MRRYLAHRTDKDATDWILSELEKGRLRQGWSYVASQDLTAVRKKIDAKQLLTQEEQDTWRSRRLLHSEPDGLKEGDVIVAPNIPSQGRWVILRVAAGGYRFDPSTAKPVTYGDKFDYAHVVPVVPVRGKDGKIGVVEADNANVDARLRSTMKARSRMWSLDALGPEIDKLIAAIEGGVDTTTPEAHADKLGSFVNDVRAAAWGAVEKRYQAAELERLVETLFARIYGAGERGARVERWGGPAERGADLIVFTQDPLGIEYKVAVQIKRFEGVHDDTHALDQIAQARREHRVDAGVVVTTAEEVSEAFEKRRAVLEGELGIDIKVIAREEFVGLLLAHVGGATRVASTAT